MTPHDVQITGPHKDPGLSTTAGALLFRATTLAGDKAGYLLLERGAASKNTVSVGLVHVGDAFRRMGVSSRLHDAAWDYARTHGLSFASGWVTSSENRKYWEKLERAQKAEAYQDSYGTSWVRVAARWLQAKSKVKLGNCYEAAANYLMAHGMLGPKKDLVLVHGEVMGQGPLEGVTFGHAWVLDGDTVIDESNGRHLRQPKSLYYGIGHVDEIGNVHEYTIAKAREHLLRYKVYGPWELKTRSGL